MITAGFIWFVVVYLVLGYFFHRVVFPEYKPTFYNYFEPGDVLFSKADGVRETVLLQVNGHIIMARELQPNTNSSALHIHQAFDELYEASEKPVQMQIGNQLFELLPGEKILVRRGVPHRLFNETDSSVVVFVSEAGVPVQYAVYLNQLYCFMDEHEDNTSRFRTLMQLSMFSQYLDSYQIKTLPVSLQKFLYFLLRPAARLLGFRSYYEEYSIVRYEEPLTFTESIGESTDHQERE
jgi:mannose-6-phosphate isomerase-like protein (cupin superfamily)